VGKVYIDGREVGTFEPQCQGGKGTAYLGEGEVGVFDFVEVSGTVYLDTSDVGTFSGLIPLPTPLGFIQPKVINPKVIG